MNRRPGRHQSASRLTATVSSLTSSRLCDLVRRRAPGEPRDPRPEGREPFRLHGLGGALADDQRALPVVAAIEHHQALAVGEAAEDEMRIIRPLGEAQPQHVHRRADVLHLQAGGVAQGRVPAVGADDEIGGDLDRATRGLCRDPGDALA